MSSISNARVEAVEVQDIRFRFPRLGHGSDAINPHTDYSNPYVTVRTTEGDGVGIGFCLGRGNEMICAAVNELAELVVGKTLEELIFGFGEFKWILANPVQSRWIAPNAGPYYMAGGAIMNAAYDAWAKVEQKPLWRVLAETDPQDIISMIDFRYVEHVLTADEALTILKKQMSGIDARIGNLESEGLPCYFTTWIGTGVEELVEQVHGIRETREISTFKVKVGSDIDHDKARLGALRDRWGNDIHLLTDANQVWSVPQAISWMKELADFHIDWIEEPTAPDHIEGHREILKALKPLGIDVVTGESCPNPHIAAQLITTGAVSRFQIDACRVMGPADDLLIMLVAAKYGVPICPHAGGSGLDELVPHLAAWNYACCAGNFDQVMVEQVGFCSQYFSAPSQVENGRIAVPSSPGYVVGMQSEALERFAFPNGPAWKDA